MTLTIAGERSSAGKTTVTLAILAYLSRRGATVQSFKVGPDYIDPMFHQYVTKRPCRNLDPVLTSPEYVKRCFALHCQSADYAVVEGVMGLFDGVEGSKGAREQGSKGAREQGSKGAREQGREGAREQGSKGARERGREGAREQGREGAREQGSKGAREQGSNFPPSPPAPQPPSPPAKALTPIPSTRGGEGGIAPLPPFASTAWVAKTLEIPVLLVIDCSKLSGSVAAIAHGYRGLDPTITIAGVVLNRVGSDRHLELLQNALEPLNIPILGVLRRDATITLGDRHLGLIPTGEIPDLDKTLDKLAQIGYESFDWEQLEPLLGLRNRVSLENLGLLREISAETRFLSQPLTPLPPASLTPLPPTSLTPLPPASLTPLPPSPREGEGGVALRIAVARDLAFNFYYQDNLDILEELGAEIIYWSPINDPELPPNIHGMYFGGGFPEVFAPQLSNNTTARAAVHSAIASGIPTIAECGGLMYLCQSLIDFEGSSWPMVGVIPANAVMGKRLTLGYRRATAMVDNPLLTAGTTVWGHEFHRSTVDIQSPSPLFTACSLSPESQPFTEGWHQPGNLHAGYIHLHWGSRPEIPARFLQFCRRFVVGL